MKKCKSREKVIIKKKYEKKYISGISKQFENTSHLMDIIPIPICKFWNSVTIPTPFRTEVGTTNLFLFLFAEEKKIFSDHWFTRNFTEVRIPKKTILRFF